jgi:WD40 repeat protein
MRSVCWFVFSLSVCVVALSGVALAQRSDAWFGADTGDVTKAESDQLGWDSPHGAKVVNTPAPGSPAEKAGLRNGDIILSLDRTVIDSSADLDAFLAGKQSGTELSLQVLAGGRVRWVVATLVARAGAQVVAGNDAVPYLMLDTGGHMAVVKGIAFTPDGTQLVTASEDKQVRVWDWKSGKTLRIIRGNVGPATEGQIYGMALSPNGRWLATGGWMKSPGDPGHMTRLYDFSTGQLVKLFKGHANIVNTVAFSPDSRKLISGGSDNAAIIWDIDTLQLQHRLAGHIDIIHAVAFTPDGQRAVTGSNDTTLRLWNVSDGGMVAEMKGHKGKIWNALGIRPSDGMIASGDHEGEIRLWDGRTGAFIKTLANHKNSVGSVTFTKDGRNLVAGTGYQAIGGNRSVRVWEVATGKEVVTYDQNRDLVLASSISPDGQIVATGGGDKYQIQLWDPRNGDTKRTLVGTGLIGWSVGFSPDGRRIAWGGTLNQKHTNELGPLEYQLELPDSKQGLVGPERISEETGKTFLRARASQDGYSLENRRGGPFNFYALLDVKKDGQTVATIERGSGDGYDHRSYTFSPDGKSIISGGSNGFLHEFDLQGKRIGNFIGHEGAVWAVAISPDGRYLVSGGGDQMIRLWNLHTRELIVTLFCGMDGEWVMWTPQGYYTGSPGADKIVGWQINKGPENAADYVGADQLRDHLNRPDIIDRAIILASAAQAVREAPGTSFKLADLLNKPLPRFRIVSPAPDSTQRGGRAQIKIAIEAVPDPVKSIRVQVNGRQVWELTQWIGSGGSGAGEQDLDAPLSKGRNDIRITLTNTVGDKTETLVLNHEGDGDLDKRGTLYILAIGVDKYPGLGDTCGNSSHTCDLHFAVADALAWADAAERRLGPGHGKVVKQALVNGVGDKDAPTASNITDAIDGLRRSAGENDTVLLFISGHGLNDGPDYRFLPTNVERLSNGALRGSTVVPWETLQSAMQATKGRRVLFIDTCHSGNAYSAKLGNSAYHANIITYASARFDQEALEDAKLGHGLFTYAVAEALDGKGDLAAKRGITTKGLAEFVIKRVDELGKGVIGKKQQPQYFRGRDAEDYVLAGW